MKQSIILEKQLEKDIYEDNRGRKILIDKKNDKVYVINKEMEGKQTACSSYVIIGLCIALLSGYFINWYVSLPIGFIAGLAVYVYYRKVHIPKLEEIDAKIASYPEKEPSYIKDAEAGMNSIRIRLILAIILPGIIVLNILNTLEKNEFVIDASIILLVIVSLAMIVYDIYILVRSSYAIKYLKEKQK